MRPVDRPDPFITAAVAGAARAAPGDRRPVVSRDSWVALTPVVAALLALTIFAAFPWTIGRQLAAVRREMAEVTTPARHIVHDVAQALVLEAAARDDLVAPSSAALARRHDEIVGIARAHDSALATLAPRLGDGLAGDVARLHAVTTRCHPALGGQAAGAGVSGAEVLAAAARLDTALAKRQVMQRERIEALESWDVFLPGALLPLLVAAVLAVSWTRRRMAALAEEAEQSHLARTAASEHKIGLLRGLTHDLKNALGAAGGYAALLRDEIAGPLTPGQRDHAVHIGRIIDRTIRAVEDALAVARSEAPSLPVRRERQDLRRLALEAASDYVAAAERAGLTLDVELADALPPVDTDASLVSEIIGNLLSNAIKYTPASGRVWLRASTRPAPDGWGAEPSVVVEVSDTGPGVPPALRGRIFDEFFRAPATAATASGDGIGLAMSRRIARTLGGEITFESEEGRGTTFTLWLPSPRPG